MSEISHPLVTVPVETPVLNSSISFAKHKTSPYVSLMAGGVAGGLEAGITVRSFVFQRL